MSENDQRRPEWLGELCSRFEAAWATDKRITIEFVLENLSAQKRPIALQELLTLEWKLRTHDGDIPTADEFRSRFAAYPVEVDAALQQSETTTSVAHQETLPPPSLLTGGQSLSVSETQQIPHQFGRHRIVRKLGQGAMGAVFLAHDEQLDRQVALKIPSGDLQQNEELRTRFQREAQAAGALHHPNICPIYDIGEFEGIHYIAMGFIDGVPLSRFAVADSGLTEQRIATLVLKIARAVAVAHEAGFIHRDLKPANVIVDHNDEPVILDFGLARRLDRESDIRVTQAGSPIGSPAYMSPEQVDGDDENVGTQADIYSLGVMLYELLTGRLPFEGSIASVMGQIITKAPAKPSDYRATLSVRLEKICLKMMAKDVGNRHASMHSVADALQEYLDKYTDSTPKDKTTDANESSNSGAQRKKQIQQLVKSGDYGQAEKLMVALSRETEDSHREAALWAADELPNLRTTREKVRAGRQEIYSTASRLVKAHDYEQAVRLLEEYPFHLRTPKMQELLEDAEGMANQVQHLRHEIKSARNRGDNAATLALVKQLLDLKPGDRRANELQQRLLRKSAGPISKAFGKKPPHIVSSMSAGVQWMLLSAVVVAACAYPAYYWAQTFLNEPKEGTANPGGPFVGVHNNDPDVNDAALQDGLNIEAQPLNNALNSEQNAATDDEQWVSLLNGNLSDHWHSYTGGPVKSQWTLNNGVLTLQRKGGGDIATKESFSDFELMFEWKISKGGNSGIIYMSRLGDRLSYMSGPEYQLLDDDGHPNGKVAKTSAGSLYGLIAPTGKTLMPTGEWNTGKIVRNSDQLEQWLNGVKVVETTMHTASWDRMVRQSPFARHKQFAKSAEGHIVLQDHGDEVSFRNIKLRDTSSP